MKKFVAILTVVALTLCLAGTAFAADEVNTNDNLISVMGTPSITVGISSNGKNVTFFTTTTSAETEDVIIAIAYLQEYSNGKWKTISTKSKTKYNALSATASKITTVSGGHYYRTKGYHSTTNDGTLKTYVSYSSRKWVS